MALFTFNAAEHNAPRAQYDVLPRGWYKAVLGDSAAAATTAGGQRLTFVATITAPEWAKGRKVFMGFNVAHPTSEEAVRIGNEQLAGLSVAAGVPSWTNTEQLHNRELYVRLKVRKGGKNEQTGEEYDDSNEPQGFDNLANYHDLAKQPVAPGQAAAPAAGFPVAPAGAPAAPVAPGVPSAASFPGVPVSTPSVPSAAPAAPAAPAAAPAVIQNAPVQPWEQQAAAAPAVAPQVLQAPAVEAPAPVAAPVAPVVADPFAGWTPEQISTWVAQNPTHPLAIERAAQAAPAAPVAPVAPANPEPATPAQPAWANAEVAPVQAAAAPAAATAPAVAEPAHPAQAAVPPWQVPAGTPAA